MREYLLVVGVRTAKPAEPILAAAAALLVFNSGEWWVEADYKPGSVGRCAPATICLGRRSPGASSDR